MRDQNASRKRHGGQEQRLAAHTEVVLGLVLLFSAGPNSETPIELFKTLIELSKALMHVVLEMVDLPVRVSESD